MDNEPNASKSATLGKFRGAYGVELDLAVGFIEEDIDNVLEQLDDANRTQVTERLARHIGQDALVKE